MALILVTGASTGLGLAAAMELATTVTRSWCMPALPIRCRAPAQRRWRGSVVGDLSDLEATLDVARQANEFGRFDAVIHNAGTMRSPDAVPVNIVAPYVLTARMRKPARLVYLSSSMHRGGSVDLDRMASATATYSDTNSPAHRHPSRLTQRR